VNAGREAIGVDPINPWRDWLYDFQSLIGGILAVIAAAFTVLQMRISDDRSERRHKEILKLQLRSDGLKLERMYFLLQPLLSKTDDMFSNFVSVAWGRPSILCSFTAEEHLEFFKDVQDLTIRIEEFWSGKTFASGQDLLDGNLTEELDRFRAGVKDVKSRASIAATAGYISEEHLAYPNERRDDYFREMDSACASVAINTTVLTSRLSDLYRSYHDD